MVLCNGIAPVRSKFRSILNAKEETAEWICVMTHLTPVKEGG